MANKFDERALWVWWVFEQIAIPLAPFICSIPIAWWVGKLNFVTVCWGNELPVMVLLSCAAMQRSLLQWSREKRHSQLRREISLLCYLAVGFIGLATFATLLAYYASEYGAFGIVATPALKRWLTFVWAACATVLTGGLAYVRVIAEHTQVREDA